MRPLFSCVVPVKGKRPFFDEAIASLRAQGLGEDLEIIIQDADLEPDRGQSDALNRGFAKARGEWFFWLNADDVLLPGALKGVASLARPSPSACDRAPPAWIAGNLVVIDGKGRIRRCVRDRGAKAAYEGRPVRVYGPSSFFRRELLHEAGGFDATLRCAMDTDLWMKFRAAGHWYRKIDRYLFAFREHDGSLTTSSHKAEGEQERQDREVGALLAAHGVRMTSLDVRASEFRRLLDGSYAKGLFDTLRCRGKPWREVRW